MIGTEYETRQVLYVLKPVVKKEHTDASWKGYNMNVYFQIVEVITNVEASSSVSYVYVHLIFPRSYTGVCKISVCIFRVIMLHKRLIRNGSV